MTPSNDILQHIKKLLALAGNNPNANEAAAAATRAQELLNEHQLSTADIDAVQFNQLDPLGDNWVDADGISLWQSSLIHQIAILNNCKSYRTQSASRKICVRLIGRESDRAVTAIVRRMKAERGVFETNCQALVLRRDKEVAEYQFKLVGKIRSSKAVYRPHVGGHQAGFTAGSKLNWSSGVSGVAQGRLA